VPLVDLPITLLLVQRHLPSWPYSSRTPV